MKFYARGSALVPDLEAHEARVRRFVGRRHDRAGGLKGMDENGNVFMTGAWPATDHPQEVPYRAEYVQAAKEGDLHPADEETARICGLRFSPPAEPEESE